jgi:hypothetical protein
VGFWILLGLTTLRRLLDSSRTAQPAVPPEDFGNPRDVSELLLLCKGVTVFATKQIILSVNLEVALVFLCGETDVKL